MATNDYVCAVWSAAERRWICAAVSRVAARIEAVGMAVILGGGQSRFLVCPADDADAAEAMAAALPAPELSVVDVVVSAIAEGRMVRIDVGDRELN